MQCLASCLGSSLRLAVTGDRLFTMANKMTRKTGNRGNIGIPSYSISYSIIVLPGNLDLEC